ncbi:hypothetical protein PAMP_020561 [Pampus punctatissimus]
MSLESCPAEENMTAPHPRQRTGCSGSCLEDITSSSDQWRTSLILSQWSSRSPSHSWSKLVWAI